MTARAGKASLAFFIALGAPDFGLSSPGAQIELRPPEPVAVNTWTVEEGLPGNAISAIEQTRDGYLWVGGLNGLARFDGSRFVRFRLRDGLSSLQIQHLLEDQRGQLWIGTQDAGLTVFHGGRFRSYRKADGLTGESVRGLAQDARGRIWVALEEGLVRWDGRFTDVSPPKQTAKRMGYNSVCCAGEAVWVVSDDSRVWELRNEQWRLLPGLRQGKFRLDRVFATQDGSLWSRLYPYGLAKLERAAETSPVKAPVSGTAKGTAAAWRPFDVESQLPESYVSVVLERPEGGLLCGSFEQGMFHFVEHRAAFAGLNSGAEKDGVLSLRQDAMGNLWVGTRTHGLLRFRQPRVRLLDGSHLVRIARLAFDSRNRLWLGGGEGLWTGQEGLLSPVTPPGLSSPLSVAALLPSASGGAWIGVQNGGLWRFDPERDLQPVQELQTVAKNYASPANAASSSRQPAPESNPIPADASVSALAEDGSGGLWLSTASGKIARLLEGRNQLLALSEATGGKRISQLTTDPDGGVWAATLGAGVVKVDREGKLVQRLGTAEGLPLNTIRCLLRDSDGTLWIGTTAGLCRWRNGQMAVFDTRHGLPEEALGSVAEDEAGRLWCAANNWLFRLDKQELDQVAAGRIPTAHPLSVGRSDGLKPVPFAAGIPPEAIRGPNGHLFFPRIWDVLVLNPKDFEPAAAPPRLIIEEAFLDGQRTSLPADGSSALRVPPRHAHLEIRYTALQWAAPETLRFRYRLEGLDDAWTETGEQRLAGFRRLPPGTYRFRVAASVAGSPWTEPGASLGVIILPAWYQTWWFRILSSAVVASLLFAAYARRVMRLDRARLAEREFSRRLMESQEQERQRLAAELHDGVGQSLLVIKNRAVMALEHSANPGKISEQVSEVSNIASQALREVRGMAQDLRPFQLDELGLTKAILAMTRRLADSSTIQFHTDVAELNGELPKDREIHFYRIIQELLTNIVKHSKATETILTIRKAGPILRALIQDNGCGFKVNEPGHEASAQGGFGLRGIRERVRTLGGQLQLDSRPGEGTRVVIEVPISNQSEPSNPS